jgi:hypothetical protein
MSAGSRFPRRDLFARAFRALVAARIAIASGLAGALDAGIPLPRGVSTNNSANGSASNNVHFQRYRVQAAVSLFGVPVIWKDGVGAASLLVEEIESGGAVTTAIQFVSGSWPERVKGFNRFGMTQEIVREENGAVRQSTYLSFMTSSPEKNSDQAWRSFAERPRNLMLAVASGVASSSGYRWALDHQSIPSGATWMDCPALMQKFRTEKSRAEKFETDKLPAPDSGERTGVSGVKACVYPTFLHSARQAMLRRSDAPCRFIHNARLFDLHPRFSLADQCVVLTGRVIERGASSESEFRVWFDAADPVALPSKIEFRPRSVLHLTFHLDSAAGGPSVRRLLIHEEA